MKTTTVNLYEFSELTEEVQKKLIKRFKENIDINFEMDLFQDDCVEQITEAGFTNPKIRYSLSYSQGDGLSFSADNYTKLKELFIQVLGVNKEKTIELLLKHYWIQIKSEGRCCFASKTDIEFTLDYGKDFENIEKVYENVQEKLQDIYLTLCKSLEKQGYQNIDYYYSDEYVIESLEANNYLADGTIYNLDV